MSGGNISSIDFETMMDLGGWLCTALCRDLLATVRATGVPAALIAILNIVGIRMIEWIKVN